MDSVMKGMMGAMPPPQNFGARSAPGVHCATSYWSSSNLCPILPRFRDIAGFLLRRATPPLQDEIFYFEIFKNFMKILKYFKTPFLKYFVEIEPMKMLLDAN